MSETLETAGNNLTQPTPEPLRSFPDPTLDQTPTPPTEGAEPPAEPAEPTPEQKAEADKARREKNVVKELQKSVDRLAAKYAAAQREADDLRGRMPKPDPATQPPEVAETAKVEQRAAEMIRQREFNAECDRVFKAGSAEIPDFTNVVNRVWDTVGRNTPQQSALVEAAIEVGDAHKVLQALSEDGDEAERISKLPPARMGAALAKMMTKLAAVPPPPPPPQSKAPPPIKPLPQGGGKTEPRLDTNDQAEFERAFAKERERRGR